jgi:hypothetical protein
LPFERLGQDLRWLVGLTCTRHWSKRMTDSAFLLTNHTTAYVYICVLIYIYISSYYDMVALAAVGDTYMHK